VVPKSVTLIDLEWVLVFILHYVTEFGTGSFWVRLRQRLKVVEDRHILSNVYDKNVA